MSCACGQPEGANDQCERCRLIALVRLTRTMREAQREYFRTRSSDVLEASKSLERQVDRAIEEFFAPPKLF